MIKKRKLKIKGDLIPGTLQQISLSNKKFMDDELFALFGQKVYNDNRPIIFNVWNFPTRDPRLGIKHPGNIPGQIALNVIYFYTDQGDTVLDPMAGGGSTIDACKVLKRECKAYDINPVRADIVKRNLVEEGFNEELKDISLIFLDPPYWKQKKDDYVEESISNLNIDEFNDAMKIISSNAYDILNDDGYYSIIIGATQDGGINYDHSIDLIKMLSDHWELVDRIIIPYSIQQYQAFSITRARKNKRMLNLYRDLLILKKCKGDKEK